MKIQLSVITILIFISLASCTKEGLGGDATLTVKPTHHGKTIKCSQGYADTVFIKFNARELPGTATTDFDTCFIGKVGNSYISCSGLKYGDYYLFVVGFDSTIQQRVKGGVAYRINRSDRKKTVEVEIPVTED